MTDTINLLPIGATTGNCSVFQVNANDYIQQMDIAYTSLGISYIKLTNKNGNIT